MKKLHNFFKSKLPIVLFLFLVPCFSLNWPQDDVVLQSFFSGFAELTDNIMSHSLIFDLPAQIKAADRGVITAIIKEPDSDSSHFYSTLGNAVIVNHGDQLISVYGNLDEVLLTQDAEQVTEDSVIGVSGSSGWQQGQKGLEFQIIDIKNQKALNPRTLMPRFETELPLSIQTVTAVNKQNENFTLGTARQIAAGQYKLYVRGGGIPYKTTVLVNGALVETITYDALSSNRELGGKLVIPGKNIYSAFDLYPGAFDENAQDRTTTYLASVVLSRGRNSIRVLLSDINNVEREAVFTVDVY